MGTICVTSYISMCVLFIAKIHYLFLHFETKKNIWRHFCTLLCFSFYTAIAHALLYIFPWQLDFFSGLSCDYNSVIFRMTITLSRSFWCDKLLLKKHYHPFVFSFNISMHVCMYVCNIYVHVCIYVCICLSVCLFSFASFLSFLLLSFLSFFLSYSLIQIII